MLKSSVKRVCRAASTSDSSCLTKFDHVYVFTLYSYSYTITSVIFIVCFISVALRYACLFMYIRLRRAKWDISIWWLTSSFYIGICDWDVLTLKHAPLYFRHVLNIKLDKCRNLFIRKLMLVVIVNSLIIYDIYVCPLITAFFLSIRLITSNFIPFHFHYVRVCEVNKSLLRLSLIKSTVWYKSERDTLATAIVSWDAHRSLN